MKIEILYVPECPSVPAAVSLVRRALAEEGVAAHVDELIVENDRMANELRFTGSPTIRINGRDVAGDADVRQAPALSCRLYAGPERTTIPSAEAVRRGIARAREENNS